ncbi:hypothetical protein [Kitasatospora sp. NPDC088548]|uniref:hypothetical protein n=1 Tax=Kitasatospora sp. NPDC088548 TaxID=3364075 RepID=UPI003822A4A9
MNEKFAFLDPELPHDVAQLIAAVPPELLPHPLANDLTERAAWAGPAPKRRKDGDSYRWLRYGAGWAAARAHRGRYAVLPADDAPADAVDLALRLHQASRTLPGRATCCPGQSARVPPSVATSPASR